jgi:lipid II:glycine glycyltransferase (peptidoglycan interpeptide bridge formation enzyme)
MDRDGALRAPRDDKNNVGGPGTAGPTRETSHTAQLFANCDSSTRRAVRKAEQSGVQIEFSRSLEAVRTFYGLLKKTRQRHGAPPQPFRFFLKLHQHALIPSHGWVVIARSSGIPVAGAVFLHTKQDAIYKYGASDERYQNLRANNLVMWRAIEWYAQNNFNSLDFGRTSLGNDGLRRFKLGWGTAERMVNYFQYNFRTKRFDVSHDEAAGWHTHIFRHLPRWTSQLIGTVLYKHTA